MAGAAAGCVTDGVIGPEVETQAKPRVIDTPKTRTAASKDAARSAPNKSDSRKSAAKPAPAAEQGDTGARVVAARSEPEARPSAAPAAPRPQAGAALIPAQSLFGNWTLGQEGQGSQDGGVRCRIVLGGVPIGAAYAARGEADCPPAFANVQTWEIQGDVLVLRNQSRGVVGRLQPTGPFRFDGQGEGGTAVYLIR